MLGELIICHLLLLIIWLIVIKYKNWVVPITFFLLWPIHRLRALFLFRALPMFFRVVFLTFWFILFIIHAFLYFLIPSRLLLSSFLLRLLITQSNHLISLSGHHLISLNSHPLGQWPLRYPFTWRDYKCFFKTFKSTDFCPTEAQWLLSWFTWTCIESHRLGC